MPRADCVCFCIAENRATGDIPALPAQWFDGLCRALPGERCTIAPVALRMADACARLGSPHHRNAWRTDPGRQDHTILPYADHTGRVRDDLAHGCPPCEIQSRRCHRRPPPPGPRFVTIAIRPSSLGRIAATHTSIPNFGKVEYFPPRALTYWSRVLPVGQHKALYPG